MWNAAPRILIGLAAGESGKAVATTANSMPCPCSHLWLQWQRDAITDYGETVFLLLLLLFSFPSRLPYRAVLARSGGVEEKEKLYYDGRENCCRTATAAATG